TYQLVKGTRGAGDSRTFTITAGTAGQAISGLTLNSTLPGNGHPVNTFTVTATNSTSGETGTSAAQTITVTDPPAISQSNPNFSTTTYPTGNAPEGLAAGDVNGDGFPDLFTADTGSNSISELLNNGNGTFAPVTTAVSVAFPHSVVLADLNADGKLDVITNSGPTGASQVAIALGNGNGTFQAPVSFGSAIGYNEALVADLNGDGKLDVAAIDQYGNTVSVFLGNGDGTFGSQANFAAGTTPTNFAIGDVNGDGKLDLVIGHSNSTLVSVLIGNGDGTFQAPADYSVGPTTSNGHVRLADVNGDGSVDIVDGVDTGTVILLNNGNGTFGSPSPASSGGQPLGLADINGDGKLDLVMTNDTNNTVAVALGNGDGTFQTASNYPTNSAQPGNGTIRDLNGDGKLDIAVPDVSGAAVSVLLNTTDTSPESSEPPTLTAPSSLNVTAGGSTPMGITASPVDSDDKLSVTISGVPLFESIKAPSGDTVTYQLVKGTRGAGDSRTFTITAGTAGQAISGLTLNSTLP
ncbi:VCBS repeat-containing protein, partial [Bradyrhizobium sp. ARR65]|uniref:FG-GAP repeat domain-containing protein n=1 Tax=Bradyrhizobium sp. ARR65 TaxID=1040989 RepID=UPI000467C63E